MDQEIILTTDFPNLKLFKRGKVRDVYIVGDYYSICGQIKDLTEKGQLTISGFPNSRLCRNRRTQLQNRHTGESRYPGVVLAKAGNRKYTGFPHTRE